LGDFTDTTLKGFDGITHGLTLWLQPFAEKAGFLSGTPAASSRILVKSQVISLVIPQDIAVAVAALRLVATVL